MSPAFDRLIPGIAVSSLMLAALTSSG